MREVRLDSAVPVVVWEDSYFIDSKGLFSLADTVEVK